MHQDFFPMSHHEESPEKPKWKHPFLDNPTQPNPYLRTKIYETQQNLRRSVSNRQLFDRQKITNKNLLLFIS